MITKAQYANRNSPVQALPDSARSVYDLATERGTSGSDLAVYATLCAMLQEGWLFYSYDECGQEVYLPPGTQIEGVNC